MKTYEVTWFVDNYWSLEPEEYVRLIDAATAAAAKAILLEAIPHAYGLKAIVYKP